MRVLRKSLIALSSLSVGLLGLTLPAAAATTNGSTCTDPHWSTSGPGGGRSGPGIIHVGDSPYILDNNMWNAAGNDVSQTLNVCSHGSWYVDDTIPADTSTAVKTYPNVHVDYINWVTGVSPLLSHYKKITSSYAGRGPGTGIYEFAYDIWLNGFGAGHNEVMIWTQNHGQTPGGSLIASDIRVSGLAWDLYASSDNSYIAFVPANGAAYPSGTLDLTAFFDYLITNGNVVSTSTLSQIDYGIEVVSTGGGTVRYDVTNFRVTPTHPAIEG
jgi:Glycosyl hydrolase family 12